MRRGSDPFSTRALLRSTIDEIAAESFVAIYPSEPRRDQRALLEASGVLVGVSADVDHLTVFTPSEFSRWIGLGT